MRDTQKNMETNLTKLNKLKNINLTESEKGLIRAHAVYLMANTPQSPQRVYSLFQIGVQHGLRIALSSFLFFVFVSGTVSAVADNALPGDPLYAFKLNVNEEVKGMFQKTPEEKVAWQKNRIENRVEEIKTLAESKSLTKAKQATVQKALDSHVKELSDELNNLSTTEPGAAISATTTLEESLEANKILIESVVTEDAAGKADALKAVDGAIKKVSNQEVKLISKEIDSITTGITTTTPPSTTTTLNNTPPPSTPVGP